MSDDTREKLEEKMRVIRAMFDGDSDPEQELRAIAPVARELAELDQNDSRWRLSGPEKNNRDPKLDCVPFCC